MVSKKIKVAHLINYLSPAGKEVGIVKLLNGLNPDVFAPVLIVMGKVFDTMGLDVDKTKLLEIVKGEGNDFSLIFKLKKIFKEEGLDIVHTHSWGTLVEGITAARLARVPIVIHGEHGSYHKDFKRKWVQKIMFSWSDQVLSVSALLADDLSRTLGVKREKILPILNGVDTEKFKPQPEKREFYRKKLNVNADSIIIGTIGRPMKVKNHQLMIKALARLKKKNRSVKFIIIGDTPRYSLREELEKLARELRVLEDVLFLGYRDDIPGYLNAFDIFVLPSLSEGCSNVIQEAMATGLPIVASRVGGNPELIEHEREGLLFTSNSLEELVTAIQYLIENPQRAKQLGQNALKKARRQFALPVMIKSYEELYLKWYETKVGKIDARRT
ncbi:glycosyl transferase group 1 [Caldithrix abyssi DSM 13497]|uniref:Glycosyl transferase group 1 n=1 Tax=Caldithrix abyssi DSM 13497 TaxID=880073 RepID=H1XXD4_CALAY|nr:glycosyltransferase [Caldithrix abyssi]APF17852.1 sugar transferase, PEP-CTERM/EpsH1 system associated [Caldithrix abyssi DSM 13497]EHO41919.1 glycosyl transferase group 1 [Caldithrix abyssi DSM 13497]